MLGITIEVWNCKLFENFDLGIVGTSDFAAKMCGIKDLLIKTVFQNIECLLPFWIVS